MLERTGDLIPVQPRAAGIPWTRRRSQILNYLHRGPVTFETLVYDTNVGDITSLSSYFNEQRISVEELNTRFGNYPSASADSNHVHDVKIGNETIVMPRLLLYPEQPGANHQYGDHRNYCPAEAGPIQTQASVQRTLDWVMNQKLKSHSQSMGEDFGLVGGFPDVGRVGSDLLLGSDLLSGRQDRPSHLGKDPRSMEALCLEADCQPKQSNGVDDFFKGSETEPANLAAALDVVSRFLSDKVAPAGLESTRDFSYGH